MRQKWTDEQLAFLRTNYHLLSYEEICQQLKRGGGAIRQQAYKMGLVKFPDDISFFTNWTEESAYFIGLFAADGYAQNRPGKGAAISITLKDGDLLLEAIQSIVGRGSLYYIWQCETYRYELESRHLYEYLCILFGHNVQRKSRTLQWPAIPDEYVRHFIRGYCDGDGHISIDKRGTPQIRFYTGSENFRDALLEKIEEFTGIQGTRSTGVNTVYLALFIGIKAICLAQWLYSDCHLALDRKRKTALQIAAERRRYNRVSVTPKMAATFASIVG